MARGSRRFTPFVVAAVVSLQAVAPAAFAQGTDAKAQLAEGEKAARGKDWAKALSAYDAANKAQPSADALEGVANAHYQLKHDGEAYAAYTEWNDKYGTKSTPAKKGAVAARLKELAEKTGTLTITVNEAGAAILVDEKPVGTSPLAAPLRLGAGPHRVRVTKDGFVAFDQAPNVSAGAGATVDVKLEAQSSKGRVVVKEKNGKAIRVIVDNVDMGEAPWSGELEAGQHDIAGRSASSAATPEKVTVERGKTHEIELVASSTTAPVKIATNDGKGLIYLDGKLVGEGSFTADIPAGPHKLRITREGYDPFEEEIVVKDKEPFSRAVTLNLVSKIETSAIGKDERRLEGLYGGFGLQAIFLVGGTGNAIEKGCDNRPVEMVGCDGGSPAGGGIGGFVGYHWDPVGVELFLAGTYDTSGPQRDWNAASTDPGIGPDPARIEDFAIRRIGGLGAARVRFTVQGEKIRFTIAGGVGVSHRIMLLERTTTSKVDPNLPQDKVVSEGVGYWAPVVSLDPMVLYRLGPSTSVGLGVSVLLESPQTFLNGDKTPATNAEGNHRLGRSGLTTPSYEMASGTQFYFGPFIGMMFGP